MSEHLQSQVHANSVSAWANNPSRRNRRKAPMMGKRQLLERREKRRANSGTLKLGEDAFIDGGRMADLQDAYERRIYGKARHAGGGGNASRRLNSA